MNFSGWLEKRGGQDATKGWKKRWCTLSDNTFKYFKNDSDSSPAGIIYCEDIDEVAIHVQEVQKDISKHGFTFKIVTKGRTYLFNAVSNAKRDEWIKAIQDLISAHKEEPQTPTLLYTTVEIFCGQKPAIRVNGDISTELMMQLNSSTTKTIQDDRGWFAELSTTHTTILNLFNQHGWSLMTAFACSSVPSNSTTAAHSDMMILTKPNYK
ncbi:PREDICTED: uncharacterized protein LOC100637413 [Amphimedon queenslandica]|uniref:PH domain-containing protein n=1 Tax=Amphimedon queenslandica TaxID=400682 RepID=I1G2N4_AMPQE|nr:PREDICTED: uncharacterized protein LOC100637413 [Amphimedon queenslandica]|eukprot:XP_003385248.1 PREDICTED: uncharacterized protein LOC100637413 [Amphimedon queenslandica]